MPTSFDVSNDLIAQYNIITLTIEDLSMYSDMANAEWDKK